MEAPFLRFFTHPTVLVAFFAGASVLVLLYIIKVVKTDTKRKVKKKNGQQLQEFVRQVDISHNQNKNRKKAQESRWHNKPENYSHPWMLTNFKGHTGQVLNMDFSSNNKYLASNGEEDGDATSETSSYSDSGCSRPSSAEPDSPLQKGLSRRQKRNLKKRPTQPVRSKLDVNPLQEWLYLQITEAELCTYLKTFLLQPAEMFKLGYPTETTSGNVYIFKGTDSPSVREAENENKQFVLDVNAQEFVPKSQRLETDSGHCSGNSGSSSDSAESLESWESDSPSPILVYRENVILKSEVYWNYQVEGECISKKKKKQLKGSKDPFVHKLPIQSVPDVEYGYVSAGQGGSKKILSEQKEIEVSTGNMQQPLCDTPSRSVTHKSHFKNGMFYEEINIQNQIGLPEPMHLEYEVTSEDTSHLCVRCGSQYHVQNGIYIGYNKCHYHVGKPRRRHGVLKYSCCEEPAGSKPCTTSSIHVWSGLNMGLNGPFQFFKKTKVRRSVARDGNYGIYAVDCEMAYTDFGLEAVKVTVVAPDGHIVYESMIMPEHEIWDYNTYYSGITEKDFASAKCLAQVQNDLMGFISAQTLLIGHGLENDLRALKIVHNNCIDTSIVFPHHNGLPYKRGLRSLVKTYLHRQIQKDNEPHDSYEDATSTMELILWKVRKHFFTK